MNLQLPAGFSQLLGALKHRAAQAERELEQRLAGDVELAFFKINAALGFVVGIWRVIRQWRATSIT